MFVTLIFSLENDHYRPSIREDNIRCIKRGSDRLKILQCEIVNGWLQGAEQLLKDVLLVLLDWVHFRGRPYLRRGRDFIICSQKTFEKKSTKASNRRPLPDTMRVSISERRNCRGLRRFARIQLWLVWSQCCHIVVIRASGLLQKVIVTVFSQAEYMAFGVNF